MNNKISVVTLAVGAMAVVSSLVAGEVTPEEAQIAAENWVKISPRRMGSTFRSSCAEEMETVRNEAGRTVFHAVNLEGGGFVVTSGDTRLSPIVAFSTTGRYSGDRNSPLYTLLTGQEEAVAALCELDGDIAAASGEAAQGTGRQDVSCLKNVDMSPFADAELEWNSLLSLGLDGSGNISVPVGMESREAISDIRVSPLLKTKWGQQGAWDYDSNYIPLYNCYSPVEGYPCGCVATAGAQIMYYHRAPSGSIAQFSNTCYVDGSPVTLNSIAGTFDWSNMFLEYVWWEAIYPDPFPTPPSLTQRQAVSKLTHNIGVAIGMNYNGGGSSGQGNVFVSQLKSRFGYKSGSWIWYDIDTVDRLSDYNARLADFNNALYASLDAKMPAFLSLKGTAEHAVVADGYGYMSGKGYTHLNVGYEGDCDLWYNMVAPDATVDIPLTESIYKRFSGLGFNIHPTLAGDILSGRVLNSSGSPVASATVTLYDGSGNVVKTSATDAKGIYSIRFTSAGNFKLKAVSGSLESSAVSVSLSRTVTQDQGLEFERGGRTGNKWGVNLTLNGTPTPTPTPTPGPTSTVTFGKNGGTGGDNYVTATYGAAMPTPRTAPTLSGWTFAGYWDTLAMDEKGNPKGKQYYDASMKSVRAWDKTSATTLWAKWTNKVTLGKNGGTGGDSVVTCTKGQPMPKRTMPTKSGYVFDGYWTSTGTGGVKYYNADGTSAHAWDKGGSVTLWAKWVKPVACKVTFGKNGGTGGDSYVTATTGKPMPTPRTAPKLSGWTFGGYWDTLACDAKGNPLGKQYYDSNMKSVRNWDKTEPITLWAKWTVRVTLGKNGGTGGDSVVTVIKGQSFPKRTMPTKSGYKFGGYFVSASSKTGQCYNADGTGTASMKWTTGGTPTIWALWNR